LMFFSSRRRHTISKRDWSSDVCSSDLSTIDTLSEDFYKNLQKLQNVGLKPIIVHGGGPAIKKMLDEQHIHAEFVDGLRKTTAQRSEERRVGKESRSVMRADA